MEENHHERTIRTAINDRIESIGARQTDIAVAMGLSGVPMAQSELSRYLSGRARVSSQKLSTLLGLLCWDGMRWRGLCGQLHTTMVARGNPEIIKKKEELKDRATKKLQDRLKERGII